MLVLTILSLLILSLLILVAVAERRHNTKRNAEAVRLRLLKESCEAGFESAMRGGIYGVAAHGAERDKLHREEDAFVAKYGYRP